jgi:ubiquinone biosynthesis protein UbiJ
MLDLKLLPTALDAVLENLLNTSVRYDQYEGACLAPLIGKTIAVQLEDLQLQLYLIIQSGEIIINRTLENSADAEIQTHSIFWPLLKKPETRTILQQQERVRFQGDAALAEQFLDCLGSLKPDAGAFIEQWLGQMPASIFVQGEQALKHFVHRLKETGKLTTKEYLEFEVELLPTREEYDVFTQQVAAVTTRVEKLDAQISKLEQNHS